MSMQNRWPRMQLHGFWTEISCNAQTCHLGIVRKDVPNDLLPEVGHKYWIWANNILIFAAFFFFFFKGHGETVSVENKKKNSVD